MKQVDLYKETLHQCPHMVDQILARAQENDDISEQDMEELIEEAKKVKGC